ncbi:hypothetical protein AX16_006086 [Volvariella volvacea WC 439]|nr:hypothetical protein AX16_006086 [Volvariella volvacea WC 439]
MSNAKALEAKEKGNAAFKTGDYPTAIGHYTAAIMADRKDPTFPLNRAAAYLKLGKHEDAERDCTTVLGLNPANAKALFRRGQAREALGKLDESLKDLQEALRLEPGNKSIQEEISKVERLKTVQQANKKPQPVTHTPPHPKRRRVPITIVDSTHKLQTSASTSVAVPESSPAAEQEPVRAPNDFGLQAVSSRPLKPQSSPSPSQPSSSSQPLPATPAPSEPPIQTQPQTKPSQAKPKSFAEAKELRDGVKPTRVGGGIFRSSGQHTVFPTRDGLGSQAPSGPKSQPASSAGTAPPTAQAPMSLFDFNRKWDSCTLSDERWNLLNSIPTSSIPIMFKTSLEAGLLASMLTTMLLRVKVHPNDAPIIREIMNQLSRVPRFETVVLFLSRAEKEVANEVWRSLGDEDVGPWKVVVSKA